jgi:exosortase
VSLNPESPKPIPPDHSARQAVLPLAVLGCYWVLLIYQLGAQWSVYEQYNYGWSVPVLCLYLLWRRSQASGRQNYEGRIKKSEVGGQKSVRGNSPHIDPLPKAEREQKSSILYLLVALCALLYAATRWLHEANPIWRLTSLLWSLEVIGFTLCFMYIAGGRPWLRHFGFPIAFFLVAVPWPSGLENYVVHSLTRLNTGITVELLSMCGVPAIQHGDVIEISNGMVGIEEACSGIRSVQATLMISLFLGEVCRLRSRWRVLLVFGGILMAFGFNVVRTFLLTWVAASKGMAAIASWHDPAGVTILVTCFICLWIMAVWLGRRHGAESRKQKAESTNQGSIFSVSEFQFSAFKNVRKLAIALLAWFVLVEVGVEWWYRAHETAVATNDRWTINGARLGPGFVKAEIPPGISAQFHSDESLEGHWRDDAGAAWQLYYFRWFPAHSLKRRIAIQFAKTHGPETCLRAIGMTLKSNLGIVTVPIGGMQFAFRQYVFLADERPLHVFYAIYEDPTGSAVLANRRRDTASRIAAAFAGSRNYGQRYLELAVAGPDNPGQALSELRGELEELITLKP